MSAERTTAPVDLVTMGSAGSIQAEVQEQDPSVCTVTHDMSSTLTLPVKAVRSRAAAQVNEVVDHTGFKALGLSPFMISRCKDLGKLTRSDVWQ
jgi:hypothetical protein